MNKKLAKYKVILIKRFNNLISLVIVINIIIDLHYSSCIVENNTIPLPSVKLDQSTVLV